MRKLSIEFLNDLKSEDGLLHPILERVRQDDTLMLAIRDDYINLYYRGGNLLRIKRQGEGSYGTFFDNHYNILGDIIPDLPTAIECQDNARTWVDDFPHLKQIMDIYFSENSKPEREFQQLIARENNFSTVSNQTEYFITDIEFADSGARFDMLAIRWLTKDRKTGSKCRAALIEMKYGDGALNGDAGLLKHLKDIAELISDNEKYKSLLEAMESQFNQLDKLGLLNFNRGTSKAKVKLTAERKPEVIIVLANHNPRSTKLRSTLDKLEVFEYDGPTRSFDLRFFVSRFAGYGLHADCMLTLTQLRELLKSSNANKALHQTAIPLRSVAAGELVS